MNIIEDISNYCEEHSTALDDCLKELMDETKSSIPGSQMLTGHLAGNFLTLFSQMMRPKCIIELGTYTGFSAICLAKGLAKDGKLITIDIDDRWNSIREKYWEKAGLRDKIELRIGPGIDILKELAENPELAFVDADKGNYWDYCQILIEKMKPGSIILVDNVLFKHEVLHDDETISNTAKHIKSFNQKIKEDSRVEKLMLPIRDGITILKIK